MTLFPSEIRQTESMRNNKSISDDDELNFLRNSLSGTEGNFSEKITKKIWGDLFLLFKKNHVF